MKIPTTQLTPTFSTPLPVSFEQNPRILQRGVYSEKKELMPPFSKMVLHAVVSSHLVNEIYTPHMQLVLDLLRGGAHFLSLTIYPTESDSITNRIG